MGEFIMKHILVTFLLFFAFQDVFALKVMTFNIWTGGERKKEDVYEILKKANADVMIINEANDADNFFETAKKLGFESVLHIHNKYNIGIISRYPIVSHKFHKIDVLSKSLVEAQIKLPNGEIVNVFGCHLVALNLGGRQKIRQKELSAILSILETKKGQNIILAGDMNEESFLDKAMKKGSISERLAAIGLSDCYRSYHQCPEVAPGFTHNILLIPSKRIDYIYASKGFRIDDADCLGKAFYRPWPSDHAALVTDLTIKDSAKSAIAKGASDKSPDSFSASEKKVAESEKK